MPRNTRTPFHPAAIASLVALLLTLCPAPLAAQNHAPRVDAMPDLADVARRLAASPERPALPRSPAAPANPAAPAPPADPPTPAVPADPVASAAIAARESLPLTGIAPAPDAAQSVAATSRDSLSVGWGRTLGAMVLVIGLIFLLRAALRRLTPGSGGAGRLGAAVQVLGRTTLGPRQSVLLLRVGPRILVVADAAGTMRTLAEVTDGQEVADLLADVSRAQAGSATRAFDHLLGRMNSDYEQLDAADLEGADDAEFHTDRARDRLGSLLTRLRNIVRQPLGVPAVNLDRDARMGPAPQPLRTPGRETRA